MAKTPGKVELLKPLKIDDKEVKELTMRAPVMRDMLAVDHLSGELTKEMTVVANLCEVTFETLEELSMVEYRKFQEVYKDFLF